MEKQTVTFVVNARFHDKMDAAAFAAIASRRLLLMMASMERITSTDCEVVLETWVGEVKQEIDNETNLERLRRKRDQAWELAGCARQDGDKKDEQRRTDEARAIQKRIKEVTEEYFGQDNSVPSR